MMKAMIEWTCADENGKYGTAGKQEVIKDMREAAEWIKEMESKTEGRFRLLRAYLIEE